MEYDLVGGRIHLRRELSRWRYDVVNKKKDKGREEGSFIQDVSLH